MFVVVVAVGFGAIATQPPAGAETHFRDATETPTPPIDSFFLCFFVNKSFYGDFLTNVSPGVRGINSKFNHHLTYIIP